MTDISEAWEMGVSLVRLFQAGPPFDMLPLVSQTHPEGPHTNYFEGPDPWELEPELRDNILNGKWLALGYLSPRRPNSKLCVVPPEVFKEGAIEWNNSGVSGDGLSYVGIRIVDRSQMHATPEMKSVGRPNKVNRTTDIAIELLAQGVIDLSDGSKRSFLPTVQKAYRDRYGETPPGYDTVRKAIDRAIAKSEKL